MQESKVINENRRPHSFEFGKPSERFKVYFENQEDLEKMLLVCKEALVQKEKLFDAEQKEVKSSD